MAALTNSSAHGAPRALSRRAHRAAVRAADAPWDRWTSIGVCAFGVAVATVAALLHLL